MSVLVTECYDFSCTVDHNFGAGFDKAERFLLGIGNKKLNGELERRVYTGNGASSKYVTIKILGHQCVESVDIPLDNGGYRVDVARGLVRVNYFQNAEEAISFINSF